MPCREDHRISAWIDGELAEDVARSVQSHVESCPTCRELDASLRSMSRYFETEPSDDASFIVRFRERRDQLSIAPWWTWRQLALGLVPLAAVVLLAAVAALWASSGPDASLQALENEALGAPVAFDAGPESVLSIAFEPFPQDIE
jgi:anti-sigma factor RsiW